ncbi:MAG: lipid-A-disaccharide synthase [Bacteroidia bacterium]|nr:lipid-A-disaccharide synthase [Bacteroidia bacterium]MCZ2277251.1 lipid-A-disaccharide synthase [Bacteroidia bacterium]
MKFYLIAGEASGDLHGSNLVAALKKLDAFTSFRGFGGDLMEQQGVKIVKHYRELAFMGFSDVLLHLNSIRRNFKLCREDIRKWKPDAVILIDYPGFNLRMAKFIHSQKIKVIYYISPQLWAWHESRVSIIKRYIDKMIVILPFEKEFFNRHNIDAAFAGHPLLDAIEQRKHSQSDLRFDNNVVALLPGSRKQEIKRMLPVMIKMIPLFPQHQFVIAGAPSIPESYYHRFGISQALLVFNKTYELIKNAKAAIVTSGTATLETALHSVPLMVCYKGNYWSYLIARQLIKVSYISLVNLIMNKRVVNELIQSEMNEQVMQQELGRLLNDLSYRDQMLNEFEQLKIKLGSAGASERAAHVIIEVMKGKKGNQQNDK